MNHRAIVLKQYQDKATKLRAELADTETAIRVLGGTVGSGAGAGQAGRNGGGKGKQAKRVRNRAKSAENLPAALAAELVRIKADASLSPIQKAQASRKARATYRANATANKVAGKPEGA